MCPQLSILVIIEYSGRIDTRLAWKYGVEQGAEDIFWLSWLAVASQDDEHDDISWLPLSLNGDEYDDDSNDGRCRRRHFRHTVRIEIL